MARLKWDRVGDADHSAGYAQFSKNGQPYAVHVEAERRGSGIHYDLDIRTKTEEPLRGWWLTQTLLDDSGLCKSLDYPFDYVERWVYKNIGTDLTSISWTEYNDWSDNHPIKKQRRNPGDWCIFGRAPNGDVGWVDLVYGSLLERNGYASRGADKSEAQRVCDKLNDENRGWSFVVKKAGKVEYQR